MRPKMVSLAVVVLLCLCPLRAHAITTGEWNIAGIHEAVQHVAHEHDAELPESETTPVSEAFLQQIYAAKEAQRNAALRFWRRNRPWN